ncbi:MAG: restriction endonuclease subunit S [Alphaproteobacteria bacterium]|nr:restriction endonuclease subunit S [Alphaproteobacteria bacterium]
MPKLNEPLNPPFKIPNSWMWVRLGDIITLISGQDLTTNEYNAIGEGVPYITGASNIENDRVIINRWTNFPKSMAQKGDLLITCKGTVGLMAFLTVDKAHIARQIMAIRGNDYINLEYIKTYLLANITTLQSQAKSMIPGISRSNILYAIIPLPPISEQKRIVDKVKSLDSLIDNLFKLVA